MDNSVYICIFKKGNIFYQKVYTNRENMLTWISSDNRGALKIYYIVQDGKMYYGL